MENKNKKVENKKKKKKKLKAWKVILLTILIVILVTAGALGGIVLAYINTAPQVNVNDFMNFAQTTKIFDKDGNYIESLHGVENRTFVPLTKIKKYTQDAFIAIEDERFEEHFGIDIKRIFGALWADIKSGAKDQGASTITQQLIKNTFLTQKKEWKRKIQEMYLAIKVEQELSKDQILEYYLNTVFLGGSAYGVQAAAEYYFDKNVDQLTIAESALIAGVNQSPSRYNPYFNEKTPEVYKERTMLVLSKMLELNKLSKEDFDKAKGELTNIDKTFKKRSDNTVLKYQWFIEAAVDSIESDLKAKYNFTDDEISQKIYTGGLRIYTTIDTNVQDAAEKVTSDPKYYPVLHSEFATYGKNNIIQPQIGVIIEDYKAGEVRAVVGGRGAQPLKSFNRATVIPRQPGSAMKPLAVYGPAFDTGYSPGNVIDDSPLTPEMASAAGWKKDPPQNYERKFSGFYTVRNAIKQSKNIVAVKLMLKIGPSNSIEYLKKFGLEKNLVTTPDKNGNTDVVPAIALGGMTKGVTPLEMAAAYGTFGNGGIYTQPILYTKVLDSEGNVILEKKSEKHKVISPQAAYLMVDTLKGVVSGGTGTKANFGSMPAAGKTGTTNEQADAYFAGLTPYYSGAVWMGHDKPSVGIVRGINSNVSLTSVETAWMWGDIMKEIHSKLPYKDFTRPDGLETASVCADSGKIPTDLCTKDPRGSRVITDIFVEGTVPTESCDVHVKALVDTSTGKLATEFCPFDLVKEKVFIKRPFPADERVGDYEYQLPGEICDIHKTETTPLPGDTTDPITATP